MSAPKKLSDLSDSERYEAYSRLFRFTEEEDIDTKAFAEKTGMSLMSVNSMIRHAKLNAKLYEEMVALGYSDKSFPVWWYSPGREGTEVKVVGQGGTTEEGGGQGGTTEEGGGQNGGRGTELEGGEDFAPTPPDTPVPKEGRPALPEPPVLSSPIRSSPGGSEDVQPYPSSSFSDAEVSLLKERRITEVTPGYWMHTQEQADGRIILTPVDPRRELLTLKRAAHGDRIIGARSEWYHSFVYASTIMGTCKSR